MEAIRKWLGWRYLFALVLFGIITLVHAPGKEWGQLFHFAASWFPSIGMLAVISAQLDLFSSIQRKNLVNIRARMYDLIHWLMLVAINIGVWMRGGVPISWFIFTLILLAIIGAQIGVGLKTRWRFTTSEIATFLVTGFLALCLGVATGLLRYLDDSPLGWGWTFETASAVVATFIVIRWIFLDISTIRVRYQGYPRAFFLKGVTSNALIFFFWIHVMIQGGFESAWWVQNAGLTFNVLVGNAIYLIYYLIYEYHRLIQGRTSVLPRS